LDRRKGSREAPPHPRMNCQALWFSLFVLVGCSAAPGSGSTIHQPSPASETVARRPSATDPAVVWARNTRSPNPASAPDELHDIAEQCGELDARLSQVAFWLAQRGSVGGYGNDVDRLAFALRAAGTPYVWPAAWSRSTATAESSDQLSRSMSTWLGSLEQGPLRRCGLARFDLPERSVFVVVASMVLADLVVPLPTRARVGQWLEFSASLRIDATDAKVILLGPTGEPAAIPTEQAGSMVRARFAAASPGQWLIQLLASGDTGPRPMLEAMLFVDVPPAPTFDAEPVPGETALGQDTDSELALDQMVTAMRQETRRPMMRRDRSLDHLAVEHAQSMRHAHRLGHDVGDGPTHERLAAANFRAHLAGENVAHAADAVRAHRTLWASPSHRSNLLHRGFARWGLGVVRDEDGSLWVCELFASRD
jgi:uncharacterized protein YkwD